MILYPAIDLKDGQAVRLLRGEMDRRPSSTPTPRPGARVPGRGLPVAAPRRPQRRLRGRAGERRGGGGILAATDVPAQLGGGIRDMATIETWLEKGIARVILGTVAVENPDLVREAARAFPGKVAVGLDARGGWSPPRAGPSRPTSVTDLARAFEDAGVAAIIYTDIDRDGAMQGPTSPRPRRWPARATTIPVIASGGVSSLADLIALRDTGVIAGAISGRALYDGALDLGAALEALA
jgi:phosphoribosylformimino-5-aminoimidazole carboxamide ribotide isomerase